MKAIARLFGFMFLVWACGFLVFAWTLPVPAGPGAADAIVVPTGGRGRIARGLELLREGTAQRMLVTGVDPEVKPREFAVEYEVSQRLMDCCITLGFEAVDTRGNADETAAWVAEHEYRSLRLVTTDWHMSRASLELRRSLPDYVTITKDPVPSHFSFGTLFLEYNKLLATFVAGLPGLVGLGQLLP